MPAKSKEIVESPRSLSVEPKAIKRIGRPPKYTDSKGLITLIDKYFEDCDKRDAPYTVTGLALALGLERHTLLDYESNTDNIELSATIKKAKNRIRAAIEEKLLTVKTSPVGLIFWLKNNAGWKDTQEHQHSGAIALGVIQVPPKIRPINEG